MRHRFVTEKSNSYLKNLLLSLGIFAAVFLAFWLAVSSVSVMRGITHCYAIEGTYPSSLDYLKENYGLMYDEDRYFIDYQPLGSNLMPDVTIIPRKERRQ